MELYSLGMLAPETIPLFEQHMLICPSCQDRVAEMDAGVQGMQAAARQFRAADDVNRYKAGTSHR